MDFFDLIELRTSTRKFTTEQITSEQLDKILAAAQHCPIGSSRYANLHLTVVQDKKVLHQLAEAAILRHGDLEEMAQIIANVSNRDELLTEGLDFDPFYDAPTVIFISHKKQDLEPGIEFCDVACVANYMQLAALNLGLGSCFMWYALDSMRRLPEYDHTELLNLPENFEPLLGLAIGVPEEPLTAKEIDLQRIKID